MGWGVSGFTCWGIWGPTLLLFLFYVNVSGMRPRFRLPFQPLTIPAPWIFLLLGWSIILVPFWIIASRFLAGNRETELKPTTSSSLLSLLFS